MRVQRKQQQPPRLVHRPEAAVEEVGAGLVEGGAGEGDVEVEGAVEALELDALGGGAGEEALGALAGGAEAGQGAGVACSGRRWRECGRRASSVIIIIPQRAAREMNKQDSAQHMPCYCYRCFILPSSQQRRALLLTVEGGAGGALELARYKLEYAVVEVLPADAVPGGGPHLEDPVLGGDERRVAGVAGEREDKDDLLPFTSAGGGGGGGGGGSSVGRRGGPPAAAAVALAVEAEGDGGGGGRVEHAEDVETRDMRCVAGGAALGVGEAGGDGEDRSGDVPTAEALLGLGAGVGEDERAELLGAEAPLLALPRAVDERAPGGIRGDGERPQLGLLADVGVGRAEHPAQVEECALRNLGHLAEGRRGVEWEDVEKDCGGDA